MAKDTENSPFEASSVLVVKAKEVICLSNYVLCPFYEFAEKKHLYCESTTLNFPNSDDRATWLRLHCCSWDFKICKFYKGLMKKYGCE